MRISKDRDKVEAPRERVSSGKIGSGKFDTLIGEDTVVEGSLNSKTSLTIYGVVKGQIDCQGRVVIGQSGSVEADVLADDVSVSGKVLGNVTAKSKLQLAPTGSIKGDIKTARLVMEDGGKFDGHCEMLTGAKAENKTKALPPKENAKLPEPAKAKS